MFIKHTLICIGAVQLNALQWRSGQYACPLFKDAEFNALITTRAPFIGRELLSRHVVLCKQRATQIKIIIFGFENKLMLTWTAAASGQNVVDLVFDLPSLPTRVCCSRDSRIEMTSRSQFMPCSSQTCLNNFRYALPITEINSVQHSDTIHLFLQYYDFYSSVDARHTLIYQRQQYCYNQIASVYAVFQHNGHTRDMKLIQIDSLHCFLLAVYEHSPSQSAVRTKQ